MRIRDDVTAVIDGILKGDILGTFDQWYADDVAMSENGADERVGKKGGERTVQKQVALQTWRDGRIVREVFNHS